MFENKPDFTPDQIAGLQAGADFADLLLQTAMGREPLYPSDSGILIRSDPVKGFFCQTLTTPPGENDGSHVYFAQYEYGVQDTQLLNVNADDPANRPYANLLVRFAGNLSVSTNDNPANSDDYYIYRVYAPDDPAIHRGGIVVGQQSLMLEYDEPIESDAMRKVVDDAHERLVELVERDNPTLAAAMREARPQSAIPTSSDEQITPPRVLSTDDIHTITTALRFATEYGTAIE